MVLLLYNSQLRTESALESVSDCMHMITLFSFKVTLDLWAAFTVSGSSLACLFEVLMEVPFST
jgi:hypothetical protein